METIKINTTQNVALSYEAAGVGPRVLAALLDGVFVFAYTCIIVVIFSYAISRNRYSYDYQGDESFDQVMIGLLILFLLPASFYHLWCETFLNGQSFGKKIMKIKVVKLNGTQPNFGSYLVRSVFRIVDRPMIALITVAVSSKSQRFGDMVAGTTVIQLNRSYSIKETILHQQKPEYKIVYQQVAMMSDKDANTIKEVIDFARSQNQPEHLRLLGDKIRSKYGISNVQQNDHDFLQTLLLDYSHYQFEK
ncbi:MAG: hypothetical protein K0S32_1555 [Bacteroidetes bacterium]|jgi:uncharacterized RDD family membrane protein YckC|nr:hypothetical protein [Bacteroidota bacterium]